MIAGAVQATITAVVLNIPSGNTYQINGTDVLTNNTLGSGVVEVASLCVFHSGLSKRV